MTTQDVDFKALYQSSLKLTTSIDDFGIPPLEKGLEQLEDASRVFQQQQQQEPIGVRRGGERGPTARRLPAGGVRPPAADKANFLLAAKGIDAEKLTKDLQSFELTPGFEPETPLGETDIEGYLTHHHEMIILTAIEDVNRRTMEATHDRMNQAMIDDFDHAKQRFLEQLGGATQMGVRSYPRIPEQSDSANAFGATRDSGMNSSSARFGSSFIGRSDVDLSQSGMAFSSSTDTPLRVSQLSVESLLTEEMKTYYAVIKDLTHGRVPGARSQFDLLGAFERSCAESVPANMLGSKGEATLKCWQLLSCMLLGGDKKTHGTALAEREFSQFFDDEQQKRLLQYRFAFGARVFLENQFRTFVQQTVEKQQLSTGGVPDLLSNIRAFVRYLQSSKYGSSASDNGVAAGTDANVWALVYYCIRCGGDQEAVDLVSSSMRAGDASLDVDVQCALRFRASQRRTSQDPSVSAAHSFSKQFPAEYERLVERYHRLTSASMDAVSVINPYERCVINLLCFGNPNASEPRILTTIEDYMWQRLCFIQRVGAASSSAPDSTYTISRLARSIQKFGPAHFESPASNKSNNFSAFLYFEILLMTQEFDQAINYIAAKGFLLEAVHFAVTLQHYGLLRSTSNDMSDVGDEERGVDMVRLIRQYVHSFQRANAVEAAEYISCIPDAAAKKELLADLLLETRKFDSLVGFTSNTDGCRTRGIFDRVLKDESEAEIKALILNAARKAESRGRPHDALALLKSAGDIEGIISLLNAQLGAVLAASRPEREEWVRVAKDFAERWMRYPWVQSIANKYLRSAALAFQTLLNISIFLDLFEKQEFEDALRFVDELDVLPLASSNNLTLCVDRFLAFDESVRQNFHLLLLGYLECLVRNTERIKAQVANGDAKRAAINSLRAKAELVVTFAGMIKFRLPTGTHERLHRMEAMIY
ncbi:TPA: hypothetical protein N0F65_002029 [Lagenidium giganteum]|uniref:Nuclear pore protein n=1 Tax=Lagenidium giganteum TaxID=4803 RepID=A0AAV2YYD0_9STRA|nr:TPA: hypothetical protein N0F65_002029 [Lagenidium giganteum]